MHRLEKDNVWRGPTDSVFFNRKRESVHNLALRLEKFGVTTYGTNTELEAELNIGKRKITIIPSWRYDEWGSDDKNDKYDVDISIPALDVTIPIRLSKFKKTFNKDSYLMKAIDVRTFITLILQRMKPEAQRGWGVYPKSHSPQVAAPGFKSSQPGPSTAIHSHTDILALKSIVLKCLLHMFTH